MKPSAKMLLLCLGVLLPVSCIGLSINSSEIVANATVKSANVTAIKSSNTSEPATESSKRFLPFILPLVFRFNRTRANQTVTTARPMVNVTMTAGNKTVVKRAIDNSTLAGFNVTQLMEQHGIRSNSSKLMQRLAARFNATSLSNISALNETLLRPKKDANDTTAAHHKEEAVHLKNLTAALNESLKEKKEDRRSITPLSNITREASALLHSLPDLVSNATASATANLQSLPSLVANATASASANIHNLPSLVSNMTANVTSWAMKIINGGETAVNETLTAAANATRFTRASTHNSTLKGNNATRHNSTHKPGKLNRTIDSVLASEKRLAATVNLTLDGNVPAVKSSNISSNVTKTDFKRAATNLTLDTPAVKSNVTAIKSDIKRPAANVTNVTGDVPAAKLTNDSLTNSTLNRARRQEPTNDDIATRSRYGAYGAPPPVYTAYTTTTQAPIYQVPVQYSPPAVPVYAAPQQQYSVPIPTYAPAYAPVSESYYTAPPAPITAAPYAPYAAQQLPVAAQQVPMGAYGVPQQPPMAYAAPQQPPMAQQQQPAHPYSAPPATYASSAGRPTEASPWL